eukprot:m51a1_g2435 putative lissencephaly-1 homolog (376) ;mRNA; f:848520-850136
MDLERQAESLQEELQRAYEGAPPPAADYDGEDADDIVPVAPCLDVALTGHRAAVLCVRFHPQYHVLVSGSEDATVRVWDFETGKLEKTLRGHTNAVNAVDFSPNGSLIASCSTDLTIKLWETSGQEACKRTLHGHDHTVSCVRFTPTGEFLVSASRDTTIRVWEVASGYCARTLYGHEEWVRTLDISPCGELLASAGQDKTVRVWSLPQGDCIAVLRGHENVVEGVCFAPRPITAEDVLQSDDEGDDAGAAPDAGDNNDGEHPKADPLEVYVVASCSRDKTVRVWDPMTSQCTSVLTGHDNWVRGVVASPNGKHVVSVSDDKTIVTWRLSTGVAEHTIRDAHEKFVTCVATSCTRPSFYATGGVDSVIHIWPTSF